MSEQYDSVPETGEDVSTPEELEVTLEQAEGGEATPDENDEVAEIRRRGHRPALATTRSPRTIADVEVTEDAVEAAEELDPLEVFRRS